MHDAYDIVENDNKGRETNNMKVAHGSSVIMKYAPLCVDHG